MKIKILLSWFCILTIYFLPQSTFPKGCKETVGRRQTQEQGRVIIFSAPSGAGKTTLMNRLISEFPNKFAVSVSTTTRSPRPGEVNGKDYHFTSTQEFNEQIKNNQFIEFAEVHGNYYGTSRTQVQHILASGKSAILVIDVNGAANVRKQFPENAFGVFISPPSLETLETRLRERKTDSEEVIQKRLKNAKAEMEHIGDFDAVVVNDNLDKAYQDLKDVIFR